MYTKYRLKTRNGLDIIYLDVFLEYERPLKQGEKIGIADYPHGDIWEVITATGEIAHLPRKGSQGYRVAFVSGLEAKAPITTPQPEPTPTGEEHGG